MNVNLNKKSVKQDGGPSHTMPDGSVMRGATHGESMAPPQQEVDPAIQEVGQYFAQAVQQGSKPEEVIMTLLEQQVDQNIIAQALMMVGYEENELQQLFQTVQELSQPQQASGPEVTRDPQELARNEAIAAEQEGLDVAIEEVDIAKDKKDFYNLTDFEQHIFTSNLKRQIVLDSVQGRAPNLAFLPIASLPEVETWIETWSFFETIHSRSYTHIIRNIYPNPSENTFPV